MRVLEDGHRGSGGIGSGGFFRGSSETMTSRNLLHVAQEIVTVWHRPPKSAAPETVAA